MMLVLVLVRAAVLLVGLAVSCSSDFAPPTIDVNLGDEPQVRWMPILKVFESDFLKKAAQEVIDSTIPKWLHKVLRPLIKVSEVLLLPEPYGEELRGMAAHFGTSLSDTIMLNFAYEASAFCTSIVAQDKHGNVYHGRNLDYPHSVLRNLTVNVIFRKAGKTLEKAEDFQDAVLRLSKIPIITGVYYIVGGARAGEGVVITRDRGGPADIWPLDPLSGGWYRVETNFDHWLPSPAKDHRREAAEKAMNATGQEHINMYALYQVLSIFPVCNGITVYTTIMSGATPEKYTTLVRPPDCRASSG
ncbi:N-acylethanolamine-hydrolyzing acid amidase-like isoform X3 [Phyllopteryx taeniolatus]|uniref:N-acylethanolamine-hydrolyzing acid amidase-like isoform X3 n=1 Tax=Phyllopteryx taeniolatus TaxID=161469 RepID=UPI002AD357F0|nr:N-acylethanolamine-hydrolyzing acid amidase-like isoform X3 [Phyllopteryx taeniolatus]